MLPISYRTATSSAVYKTRWGIITNGKITTFDRPLTDTFYRFHRPGRLPCVRDLPLGPTSPLRHPRSPMTRHPTRRADRPERGSAAHPTLIATDRAGADFAITFEDRGIDLRPVKSGWTVVVPGATRTSPAEGKRGFVRVGEGRGTGVHYLPAGLERVLDLGRQLGEAARGGEAAVCAGCEKEETEGDVLMRCTGCGRARYCSKVCQKKDWGEGGHKVDCKVFKAMAVTWGA
ncbi:conserved hypothetical protein [Verticillium alfalfae VaMs.102]|uniref:MYND-type domain-containing protein n=1 Tax=Verticillium alfalfae (strain VaMs.102 / ATCC MYA-4576 / FGSC 10136) TaxID=526221 RepID=C9S6P6_VERA1|nr:conserved hypothetical protein [Verticillium alfalfae VaMs.102]EEY14537.1 conserved hypothetical protein [Verticillium alfalfae VaMs.102]